MTVDASESARKATAQVLRTRRHSRLSQPPRVRARHAPSGGRLGGILPLNLRRALTVCGRFTLSAIRGPHPHAVTDSSFWPCSAPSSSARGAGGGPASWFLPLRWDLRPLKSPSIRSTTWAIPKARHRARCTLRRSTSPGPSRTPRSSAPRHPSPRRRSRSAVTKFFPPASPIPARDELLPRHPPPPKSV